MKYVTINQWDIIDTREYITIDFKKNYESLNPLQPLNTLKKPRDKST